MQANIQELILSMLKQAYGSTAEFRDGQYEAIEATLTNKRTLVVQKTGWGKSLVYFLSTKYNRSLKKGVTLIVSPLLVLMENQITAGKLLELQCGVLNSTIKEKEERQNILFKLKENQFDVFFITPETLFSDEFQAIIGSVNIGLFVIDECHCISDWGHDFRIEYSNLFKVINYLPSNVPVLGTTATANNRVVDDLKKQFGNDVYISRGPLTRDSLHIEIVRAQSKAKRYAWLVKNVPKLPGSGIIYCLTQRDCQQLSDYLNQRGILAMPYYSDKNLEEQNHLAERKLMNNEIKVLVSTIKLGMGYDKPDISFVIHYQQPGSVVAYYQQIGRAGRSIKDAYCYLLTGQEDQDILNYFIENAFPTNEQAYRIIHALENSDGLSRVQLETKCNIEQSKLVQFITLLENEDFIYKNDTKYYRSAKKYMYNGDHYQAVKQMKYAEKEAMKGYIETEKCLSRYIVNLLDDGTDVNCGKCYNCMAGSILPTVVVPSLDEISVVAEYLDSIYIEIEPRKRWPQTNMGLDEKTVITYQNEYGVALARYGDIGYGQMVSHDKYHASGYREELISKSVQVLQSYVKINKITHITIVPSFRNTKVNQFAKEIAKRLNLQYVELFSKRESPEQKKMQNSYFQAKNVIESVFLTKDLVVPKHILLVDDIVDSRWTLTVCGWLLKQAGAVVVVPYCLADSSEKGGYR
ncbi:MAG: RecQ family ATP-dependent DNA helicase [Erysipelotrichaceae bacterium]